MRSITHRSHPLMKMTALELCGKNKSSKPFLFQLLLFYSQISCEETAAGLGHWPKEQKDFSELK